MKKILLRARMSPFDNIRPTKVLTQNLVGDNIGNMIFPYSVSRALMTEGTEIHNMNTEASNIKHDFDFYNSEYSALVLPFANAFRKSFENSLETATSLIKRLSIPCVVAGVGFQGELDGSLDAPPSLDKATKRFVSAVLDKSATIGVRGEVTGKYLEKLGFKEDKHFSVIGCPSMFLHGEALPKFKVSQLTPKSHISFNGKTALPEKFHHFLTKSIKEFENYHYVPQVLQEITLMYAGWPFPGSKYVYDLETYPVGPLNEVYRSDRGISFTSATKWIEYFKDKEFSFGSRIHGNITALLGGCPAFITVSDSRTAELARYHNIPHCSIDDLNDDVSIFDLHEKADFDAIHKGHNERFARFVDFLDKNELDHIYKESGVVENSPFDQKIASIKFRPPLHSLFTVSQEEQAQRLLDCFVYINDTSKRLRWQVKKLQSAIKITKRFKRFVDRIKKCFSR